VRLNLTIENFSERIEPVSVINDLVAVLVQSVIYDSRKISSTEGVVFFALEGTFRSGSEFIEDAYKQGIRIFVVPEGYKHLLHKDCCFFFVPSCLEALQKLAQKHRQQFNVPVIAVAGSNGKTTVKEWIHYFLAPHFKVVRSPKSYNSQLGVALSLLEINEHCEIAIIEAGVSEPGEMKKLEAIIQPNFGVLTSVSHHKSTPFENQETYTEELLSLFRQATITWVNEEIQFTASPQNEDRINKVGLTHFSEALSLSPYQDKISVQNLSLVLAVVTYFVRSTASIDALLPNLPRLAMRMETFEGIHNNTIINDAYNLDLDALEQSLEFQKSISGSSKRVAIVSMNFLSEDKKHQIEQLISQFSLDEVINVEGEEIPKIDHISNATVLIKGARNAQMQRIAGLFYLKKHITQLEINLSAVRHNVTFFRKKLPKNCQIIAMVKAASYGSGALKMAQFLNGIGIDYLGVAYVDEGVELRRNGIQLPMLVMNSEDFGFEDIVDTVVETELKEAEIVAVVE